MRRTVGIGALTLVVACTADPPPKPEEVRPETPAAWEAEETSREHLAGRWWASFEDERLDEVVREALAANHDLRAAAARVVSASARATIAGADLYPHASAGFDAGRAKTNIFGFPFGGANPFTTRVTQFGLALNLSWEIDLWGRLRAGERAAVANLQAAEADFAGAALSLSGQMAKSWFAFVETRQQELLAEETAAAFGDTERELRDRYELGLAPQLDLRLASSDRASAQALVEQRRRELALAVRLIEILLGRYPSGAIEAPQTLPAVPPPVPAGLPADLVRRRPDLLAAERRADAALARGEAARAALYPRLTLTASGGTRSTDLEDLLDGDFRVWSLGAGVLQPIFEGGRLRAQVELEDAETRAALEDYANRLLGAYAEVEAALASEPPLRAEVDRLANAIEEAEQALSLAEDRYRQGVQGFLVVLESRRRVLGNRSAYLLASRRLLDNRIDLYLALGGGFDLDGEPEDPFGWELEEPQGETRENAPSDNP